MKNNCVETKDRITGYQLCRDFIGSAGVEENMKIMPCCPQVRGLQGWPLIILFDAHFTQDWFINEGSVWTGIHTHTQRHIQQKSIKMQINCGRKTTAWWEGEEETDREKEKWAKAGDVSHEVRVISLYNRSPHTGGFVLVSKRSFVYLMPQCEKTIKINQQEPWWVKK